MLKKLVTMMKRRSVVLLCSAISGVVLAVAPLISNDCQIYWYQDKEPEGLEEFARRRG